MVICLQCLSMLVLSDTVHWEVAERYCKSCAVEFQSGVEVDSTAGDCVGISLCRWPAATGTSLNQVVSRCPGRDPRRREESAKHLCTGCHQHHLRMVRYAAPVSYFVPFRNMDISHSLSILTAVFPGEPGLAGFIEAKDDGSDGDNWSYKTCKAPVKLSLSTNQHPVFTGQMSFLSLNQWWQSTEGKISHFTDLLAPSSPWF